MVPTGLPDPTKIQDDADYTLKGRTLRIMNRWFTRLANISGADVTENAIVIRQQPQPVSQTVRQSKPSTFIRITGNATGGGKYIGKVIVWRTTEVSLTTNLAQSDVGTTTDQPDVLVLNTGERGQSTHDLTTLTPIITDFPAFRHPMKATDGKDVYVINGFDWKGCTGSA
jgi:hypothetical protein